MCVFFIEKMALYHMEILCMTDVSGGDVHMHQHLCQQYVIFLSLNNTFILY